MQTALRPRTLVLFVGDIAIFVLSLWLSLSLRALALPSQEVFFQHLFPFSLLFVAWVFVFFVAGLYESRLVVFARRALSATLLVAQAVNMVIAALFFFLVPLFGIAPKTLLLIYLFISFILVLFWRAVLFPRLGLAKPEQAVMVGASNEVKELAEALNNAHRAPMRVAQVVSPETPDLSRAVIVAMEAHRASIIIADFDSPVVTAAFPQMYNLLAVGVRFTDALTLYENIFGRIPLSRLTTAWLARNVSRDAHLLYDPFKRAMDILAALVFGLVSLLLYPFIVAAIKLDDGGEAIIPLPRIGEGSQIFSLYKFRTLTGNDKGAYGADGVTKLTVTRAGKFLRASRLDELPQLWNILKGDLSLIGPRPETPSLVAVYEEQIPYYNLRHLVKPGLSGWAQLYHHADPHGITAVEDTRDKLSYDLYYLKHRSVWLDLVIALKTIRRVLMRGNA